MVHSILCTMTTETRVKILGYIKTNGQARVRDLVDHLGIGNVAVHRQLKSLVESGKLTKVGSAPNVLYYLVDMSKQKEVVDFWLGGAQEDWEFAVDVWKSGKRTYNALFFAQLSIEKVLKALHYHKKDDHPLLIHDLVTLAESVEVKLTAEQIKILRKITSFHISARYDDYKYKFRQQATKDFVDEWMNNADEIRGYLLKLFK